MAREFSFRAAAFDYGPPPVDRVRRRGISANLDFEGVFQITFSGASPPAFWSACLTLNTANDSGHGYGFAAGIYGPYTIGSPCDFAHATPTLERVMVPVIMSLGAQDGFGSQVLISLRGFDALGNSIDPGFSRYDLIAGDVPEPSVFALALVPLAAVAVQLRRRAVRARKLP